MSALQPHARQQRGVAIVLAMAVVAMAVLAATAILVAQSTWSRQLELSSGHAQAERLIQAGLDWSRAVLGDDRRLGEVDYLGEPWALQLPPMPVENGSLAGRIEDQQGKFNLNNLLRNGQLDIAQLARFRRLLAILDLPPALADTLADWIDADRLIQPPSGAEDAYYLSLPSPYLAANAPLIDIAELALVRGYDDSVRARLRPFVTALPVATAVNVNTASAEVIAASVDGLAIDAARAIVAKRERSYFRSLPDFFGHLPGGSSVAEQDISVSSNYFIASMTVSIEGATARGSALLVRGSVGWPAIVWRKQP